MPSSNSGKATYSLSRRKELLPKKEQILLKKELAKLQTNLNGIRNMKRVPDAIFVIDTNREEIALHEAHRLNIPVVGMGGVQSAEDVLEMMLAGATAVEVGAANLVNPFASLDIVNELPAAMEKYGINDLNEIIGGAHNG